MAIRDNLNGNISVLKRNSASPYNFKGSTTYSKLPTKSNVVNDTYYCTDKKCNYTWNGSAWFQSSMNETEYAEEFNKFSESVNNQVDQLSSEIDIFYNVEDSTTILEIGGLSAGVDSDNSTRLRTDKIINDSIAKIEGVNGFDFFVYAYLDGKFVGHFANGEIVSEGVPIWLDEFLPPKYCETGYDFRICCRDSNNANRELTLNDATNIKFYSYRSEIDVVEKIIEQKYISPLAMISNDTKEYYSLTDFNNAEINKIYCITSITNPLEISNSPISNGMYGRAICATMKMDATTDIYPNNKIFPQIIECSDGRRYTRVGYNANGGDFPLYWSEWIKHEPSNITTKNIYVEKDGSGTYTTVKEAFENANVGDNVYIGAGTFDLIDELGGQEYFDTHQFNGYDCGLVVDGFNVYMTPQTILQLNYEGTNGSVMTFVSPLNLSSKNCEIVGGKIIAKTCRYCIHDECYQETNPYHHVLKNLDLYLDNTNNTSWTAKRNIGGGLGVNGMVTIENCYTNGAEKGNGSGIAYHSCEIESEGFVTIKDCYCDNGGTIRLAWMGDHPDTKTKMLVSNCSLGSEIIITTSGGTTSESNIVPLMWNNVIRND